MLTDHGIAAALRGLEDAELRLVETNHRIANELAAAIAALRIAGVTGADVRGQCIETAVARLEACAHVHTLLSTQGGGDAPLGEMLEALCNAVARTRLDDEDISLALLAQEVEAVHLAPLEAQRVGAIICELVTNAIKHAPAEQHATVEIRVMKVAAGLRIVVTGSRAAGDPLAALAARRSGGYGRPILSEMVRRIGGTVITDVGSDYHQVDVRLPDLIQPVATTQNPHSR